MEYETIVVRSDNSSIAHVKAETSKSMNDEQFFSAVRCAVTNWINETNEGVRTLIGSSDDLNIGDLSCVFPNEDLTHFLAMEGIMNFDIEIRHLSQGNSIWTYDTHVFNIEDIDDEHVNNVADNEGLWTRNRP